MNIDEYLPALREAFIHHGVVLAYLFGSQAEGTARPSSDIDLAALLRPGTPRERFFDVRLSLMNAVMDVLHTDKVDLVILNEATPLLMHQVVKFGRVLYEDPVTRPAIDFYVYALSRYSDAEHYRQLAHQYLREGIERFRASHIQST
jgi:predicted nucleotidyltransferase